MSPDDLPDEDHTVVGRRRGPEHAADEEDRTVVSSRSTGPEDDGTVVSHRGSAGSPAWLHVNEAEPDRTAISSRHIADEEDHTVVARGAQVHGSQSRVSQAHGSQEGDHTLIVGRGRKARTVPEAFAAPDPTRAAKRRPSLLEERITGRRRGIAPPELSSELKALVEPAVDASGPGAVSTYRRRDLPSAPAAPAVEEGAQATRASAPSMPSVQRKGRSLARVALVAFAIACVVSAAGIAVLVIAVL